MEIMGLLEDARAIDKNNVAAAMLLASLTVLFSNGRLAVKPCFCSNLIYMKYEYHSLV
jgi:hypothetical protein